MTTKEQKIQANKLWWKVPESSVEALNDNFLLPTSFCSKGQLDLSILLSSDKTSEKKHNYQQKTKQNRKLLASISENQ